MTSAASTPTERSQPREVGELTREECLALLAERHFGRVVVAAPDGSIPLVRPINYVFDPRSQAVVFRTAGGSKLHALLRSARAAFEIDDADADTRTGWSVIVRGVAEQVRAPTEIRRLDRLGLDSWVFDEGDRWIRIRTGTISGRRVGPSGTFSSGAEA